MSSVNDSNNGNVDNGGLAVELEAGEVLRNWLDGVYDSDDDEEMEEDDVTGLEIVGVSGPNDVIDVTDLECPICFNGFKDGQEVAMFGCDFKHYLCLPCARRWDIGDNCHMCRTVVTEVHTFTGMTFNKGVGTNEDPITISD